MAPAKRGGRGRRGRVLPGKALRRTAAGLPLLALLAVPGCAGDRSSSILGSVLERAGLAEAPLDEGTIASALREALRIGAERAVERAAAPGGFLEHPELRIGLPEPLEPVARALRRVGFGSYVDELELGMNHAAELAAGEALPVFLEALGKMTLEDARSILEGGDTAATDFFRRTAQEGLRERLRPLARGSLEEVRFFDDYARVADLVATLPFLSLPDVSLEGYVADRTTDGLFALLAEEERRIREDPAARVTPLLRRVFGRSG